MEKMWLSITDIKKDLKSNLSSFFKEKGYQYKTGIQGGSMGFVEKSVTNFFFLFFNVYTSGKVWMSPMCGYSDKIERLLFKIKLPDKSIPYYYSKEFDPLNHITLISANDSRNKFESDQLYSGEDVSKLCNEIVNYYEIEGKLFTERFDSLEKVYYELIDNMGRNNLDPIFSHSSRIFKATIILSIFEDDWIGNRVPFFENEIAEKYKNPDKWLKAYRELCYLLKGSPRMSFL